jgi:DNA-binding LacI/PurR family transcriptional regulator
LHDLVLARHHRVNCGAGIRAASFAVDQILHVAHEYPQAFYCTGDATAIGVIESIRRLGWQVPQDVWVIGHGNSEYANSSEYSLTSVAPAFEHVAQAAIETLLRRLEQPDLPMVRQAIDNSIVIRGTTAFMDMKSWPDTAHV